MLVSTGDNMEKRKRLSESYLETLALNEYEALRGRLVRVRAINGYADDIASDTFHPDMTGEPVVVRVGNASVRDDIHRWMDEWLDPAYPVEIVSRGDLPATLHSCWIYGNCRSLDGGFEPGDIWAPVGKHCDLPPIEELVGVSSMFCEHANECPSLCRCPPECSCRETMCRSNTRYDIAPAEQIVDDLFAKRLAMPIDESKRASDATEELLRRFGDAWKLFVAAHNLDGSLERDFRHWCRGQGIDLDRVMPARLEGEYVEWMMSRMMRPLIEKICALEDRVETLEKGQEK